MKSARPKNVIDFTLKRTVEPNGNVIEEINVTPDDIKATIECGMTPEQSLAYFHELAKINRELNPSSHPGQVQGTQPATPPEATSPITVNDCTDNYLSKMFEKYYEDLKLVKQDDWKPASKHITFFRRLKEIIGDKPVQNVTREDAKTVFRTLKQLPADNAKFRDLTVPEIVAINQDGAALSEKTINDHLELYNRFFKWVITEYQLVASSPFEKLRITANKKEKANQKRNSFTNDELKKIFSTPIFTSGQYGAPYKFWAPLIALYTGARNAEIAALNKDDIRQIGDTWVIDFNENTSFKRLKSANSIRKTPIHPHLIEVGLLAFVESCADGGRLFPELSTWTEKEGYARPIGDWFNRDYLVKLRIYEKRKKVFYSFRHTLTSALDRAGVSDTLTEQICGREAQDKTLGRSVYTDDATATRLFNEIIKIDFRLELEGVQWVC